MKLSGNRHMKRFVIFWNVCDGRVCSSLFVKEKNESAKQVKEITEYL